MCSVRFRIKLNYYDDANDNYDDDVNYDAVMTIMVMIIVIKIV